MFEKVHLPLFADRFYGKKGHLFGLSQELPVRFRNPSLRDEANSLTRPVKAFVRTQRVTSFSNFRISFSASFRSASISSNARGGVYL